MSGQFSIGGLVSGLDTESIIEALMQIERQPVVRMQERIATLGWRQDAVQAIRTQLNTLLTSVRAFQNDSVVDQYESASSDQDVLTTEVTGSTPVSGSYNLEVLQLASATVASSSGSLGAAINPAAALNSSGMKTQVAAGDFTVNGVTFTVDPTTDTLDSILADINASAAGVVATYDPATDRVTFENAAAGDTSIINFGAEDDDSNFLAAINVTEATQATGGSGSTVVESTRNLGSVNPLDELSAINFGGGAVTSGSFQLNGVTITVDASAGGDSLIDVINRINDSDAGVTASYDASNDTIRVVSDTLGSRTVKFTSGTSNFLDVTNLTTATQEAGNDAQFTINGGATQTRNTNEVSDAIGGITLNLLSEGTSTVTISSDDDTVVEDIQAFVDELNNSFQLLRDAVSQGGALESDFSIRTIDNYFRYNMFNPVEGIGGDIRSLLDIGISTGSTFDSGEVSLLQLDEEELREALREDRSTVAALFSNKDGTGIADLFETYLDEVTSTSGFLHQRSRSGGTIDNQIRGLEDQMERLEDRVALREQRLRSQFTQMEQLMMTYQSQTASLSGITSGASFL